MSHIHSQKHKNALSNLGRNDEPTATPSVCLEVLPSKIKEVVLSSHTQKFFKIFSTDRRLPIGESQEIFIVSSKGVIEEGHYV